MSENGQLRAVHLILDFEPLSNAFQDVGHAIRAGDPRIHQIDVSWPGFLAQEDLPLVEYPLQHSPREVVVPREETASLRLSLEAEIDQFQLEEEEGAPERLVELSDSEAKFDRLFVAHSPRLIVARVDTSSEEDEMALNRSRGLKDLVAGRKGSSSKDAPQTQLPPNPPLPSLPSPLGLHPNPNLQRKKRKGKDNDEGEIVPLKDSKQQRIARDKRGSFVESKEDSLEAKVRQPQRTCALRLELDGTAILWDASVWDF